MTTAAELFLGNADSDETALHFEDRSFTYRQLATEIRRRAGLWDDLRDPGQPSHIGLLLDNTPEYVFWMGAAALTRSVVVGINATYRGEELARLITHSDCQLVVTSEVYGDLLEEAPAGLSDNRLLRTDDGDYQTTLGPADPSREWAPAYDEDLFLLIFTSGSTHFPKAVRCTQGRFSRTGAHVAGIAGLGERDAVYSPLPFFHSSSLFTGMSSAFNAKVPLGTRARFSASQTMEDVRRTGATLLTYTGKVLNYILAVPPAADDGDNPLRLAIGNEASESDIRSFAARFCCEVRDSYGSTEGMIIIRRDTTMPAGALGCADEGVAVLDPSTGRECPRIERGVDGKLLNAEAAVGEIVNRSPSAGFEGYYKNAEATTERLRDGFYWSGDLAYRDADGWFFFAGRSNEWLRVDGENFSAGPVEAILGRYPQVRSVAVYAVPDDPVGDRVMAALELGEPESFDPAAFDAFLDAQLDLGPKWVPAFVRVSGDLPKLASMKLDKTLLRREVWRAPVTYWRTGRGEPLVLLGPDDLAGLSHLLT